MKKDETCCFLKSLFAGEIEQNIILPYPELDAEEHENLEMIVQAWREFAKDAVDAESFDRNEEIPAEVIDGMKEMGLFGLPIPEEFDGAGLTKTAYCRIFEEISRVDASLAVTVGAHASIGTQGLLIFGTDKQKAKYLPKLATGEMIACFALTEPGAGSDAAGITTHAELNESKDAFILNGQKIWISNGAICHLITVFAKTKVKQDGVEKDKITAFLVEADWEGVSRGKKEEKMGIRGSNTTTLNFDNVRVPVENMLGPLGKGFRIAMDTLNTGRLGLAAGCVGGIKEMVRLSTQYAKSREQFGKPIADFEIIKDKISTMTSDAYAGESMVYLTTALVDKGNIDVSLESAICKVFASDAVWHAVDETVQIAGGLGYSKDYPYERHLRDARINMIFEGTNEILRLFIALAGMQGPGEYLKQIGKALRNPIKGFGLLTGFVAGKVKDRVTKPELTGVCPELKLQAARFDKHAAQLAKATEKLLMRYGKNIIHKEFLLQRIANIAIHLYAMAAVISRVSTNARNGKSIEQELPLAKLVCTRSSAIIRTEHWYINRNHDDIRCEITDEVYAAEKYPCEKFGM